MPQGQGKFRELVTQSVGRIFRPFTFFGQTYSGKATGEFQTDQIRRRRKHVAHALFNLLFAVITALILTPWGKRVFIPLGLRIGDVAENDIISPITAYVEPVESSSHYREQRIKQIPPIFDYDERLLRSWLDKWRECFQTVRADFYAGKVQGKRTQFQFEAVSKKITEVTGQKLEAKELLFLHEEQFSAESEKLFARMAEFLIDKWISPIDILPVHYSTGIIIRHVNQGFQETGLQDLSRIISVDMAKERLAQVPAILKMDRSPRARKMAELISGLITPNLIYNDRMTQKRISAELASAPTQIISLREGQAIIRRNEHITQQHMDTLKELRNLTSFNTELKKFAMNLAIFFTFFSILFRINIGRRGLWHLALRDSMFFLVVSGFTWFLVRLTLPHLNLLTPLSQRYGYEYLFPISTAGIILNLVMGKEVAVIYAIASAFVMATMLGENMFYALWATTVTLTAVHTIKGCKQRSDLFRCGVWSGGLGAVVILAYAFIQVLGFQRVDWAGIGLTAMFALLSGVISSGIVSFVIPVVESVYGYTTSLKLLELSNFNHPLLHTLMMKAPGTYHHSVIVGSLAELAADRIHANGLLARVSAYYHDIGKMGKPLYFIENQAPNDNPHDHLNPSMSAKILHSHVKNGVRLGREYNLGAKVIDIIEQHHGTTLVSYFFNKAKNIEDKENDPVDESHFRYPGPKPRSREAAIVMIADACEAATRSIAEPTPAKIQAMVHSIITKRFLDEQLTECDLTFSDLQVIEENFTRTLVSLYHHRIEYPGQRKAMATVPQQPTPPRKHG